jgi:excisionase family DNA binding protein
MDDIKAKYAEYLTTKEVAALLRTSPETIRYWAWRGDGPKSFKSGRQRLFAREDVDAYIAERRAAAEAS